MVTGNTALSSADSTGGDQFDHSAVLGLVADVGGSLRYERDGAATRFVVELPAPLSTPNQ